MSFSNAPPDRCRLAARNAPATEAKPVCAGAARHAPVTVANLIHELAYGKSELQPLHPRSAGEERRRHLWSIDLPPLERPNICFQARHPPHEGALYENPGVRHRSDESRSGGLGLGKRKVGSFPEAPQIYPRARVHKGGLYNVISPTGFPTTSPLGISADFP